MGRTILAALLALAVSAGARAQAERMQIQFAEKANIAVAIGPVQFSAYGRSFSLILENNERLMRGMSVPQKANLTAVRLLRGTVQGSPGSWVRLTTIGSQLSGAFWDGTDLYLVGRHDSVAPFLTHALEAAPAQTVVFRLSDTVNFLPPDFCATRGLKPASTNGLAQYKALVNELKVQFVAAPTDQLDISVLADSALAQQYSTYSPPENDVRYAMLKTLNLVDGIYDAQLGLMITASELHVVPAASDPFTANDSSALLDQLRNYRAGIPALNSRPISHLFTQRILDGGGTLGIASIGGACDLADGVSLTSVGFSGLGYDTTFIVAHELGHNLNAEHDTDSCGFGHIMWPEYGGPMDGRFSQCSINQMQPFIEQHRGSCFTSPLYGDVESVVGSLPTQIATEPFVWPVYVRSVGTAPATDAVVYIDMPNGGSFSSATPSQGTCSPFNGSTRCLLGTLAAGAEARLDLLITSDYRDVMSVRLNANAANDRYETNNIVTGTVQIQPPATLAMSVSPNTADALVGDVVPFTFTITAGGPRTARDVELSIFNGGYVQFVSATPSQGTCSFTTCMLGNIPTGSSAQVTVQVRPQQGERLTLSAQLSSSNAYRESSNITATINATATFDLAIQPPVGLQHVAIGVPFDVVVPIRANGTRPVSGGLLRVLFFPATFISADLDGTPCTADQLQTALGSGCPIGTLNPGDTRTLTVRLRFDAQVDTNIHITADILNDELWSNNSASVPYQARHATDVSLNMFPNYAGALEGVQFSASAGLRSQGAQDAANVTATLDVPVGVRIISATLPGGTCTPTGVRRMACTLALLTRGTEPQMTVRMVGDEPANYVAAWTIAAANDGVPANNSLDLNLQIIPRADVGVRPIAQPPGLIVGRPQEFTVEVYTGSERPAENVVVNFPESATMIDLEAVATTVGTCVLTEPNPHCDLGTLAPNSVVLLTPRYRALLPDAGMAGSIYVSSRWDFNHDNDFASIRLDTYEEGDVDVRVASTTISGTVGDTIVLPTITVSSGTRRAYDVRIDIPLPSFVSVETMSGTGVCVGASPMTCMLGNKEPNTVNEISITVKLNSAGTFTSDVLVHAMNDTNPANDAVSLQVRSNAVVTPPPPPPPSGGGGGGGRGGGSLEWLSLACLSWLTLLRFRRAQSGGGTDSLLFANVSLCPTKKLAACVTNFPTAKSRLQPSSIPTS